jgi:MFS transporter, DHA3 family, macrolide efflux protein
MSERATDTDAGFWRGGRALTFFTIWFGQMVSLLGSVLTEFALGVWIFQRTGSATQFALFNLFVFLPQIVVMPFGGVLADRYSRRGVMVLANAGGALTTAALIVVVATGTLDVWSAYLVALSFAALSSLLTPSYITAIPLLVPNRHLGRANGMMQFAVSVARTVSPALGGFLVVTIGLGRIAAIDLVTFLLAIGTLLAVRVPAPADDGPRAARRRILREAAEGLEYIVPRRGLLGLLVLIASFNVAAGFSVALTTPLVLSTGSPRDLGLVTAAAGAGLLVSSAVVSIWGGPRRRALGVLGVCAVMGLAMVLPAARGAVLVYAAWTFIQNVCATVGMVSNLGIWQSKVPAALQGRVIGSLRTVTFSTLPITFVLAGPLADRVFEPLMSPSGALSGSVGRLMGVGPGRGIALLLLVVGVVPLAGAIVGYLSPRIRGVEDEPWEPAPAPAETAVTA